MPGWVGVDTAVPLTSPWVTSALPLPSQLTTVDEGRHAADRLRQECDHRQ